MNATLLNEHMKQLSSMAAALRAQRRELYRMLKVNPSLPVHDQIATVQMQYKQVRLALEWFGA